MYQCGAFNSIQKGFYCQSTLLLNKVQKQQETEHAVRKLQKLLVPRET